MKKQRIITRYENRKLYDTAESRFITLKRIGDLIRQGETVKIVEKSSGSDITSNTLTQIILEEDRKGKAFIPVKILHDVIRWGNDVLDTGVDQVLHSFDDVVENSIRRLIPVPGAKELEKLRSQINLLEKKIEDLVIKQNTD
jgi:polyhydroxyalkanoate synthesis repressor PhaR